MIVSLKLLASFFGFCQTHPPPCTLDVFVKWRWNIYLYLLLCILKIIKIKNIF